jgi:hypothetical protein
MRSKGKGFEDMSMSAQNFTLELHAARFHATASRIGEFAAMGMNEQKSPAIGQYQMVAVVSRTGRQYPATSLAEARRALREDWGVESDAPLVVFGVRAAELSFATIAESGFTRVLVPYRAGYLAELGERLKPETIEAGCKLTPSALDTRQLGQQLSELLDHATQQLTRRGLDFDDVEVERLVGVGMAGDVTDRITYLDFQSDDKQICREFAKKTGRQPETITPRDIETRELCVKIILSAPDLLDDVVDVSENQRDPVHDAIRQRLGSNWRAEASPGGLMLSCK